MMKKNKQKNKGFTILEALVAVLILSISVSSMLSITASSTTGARYAQNEITANYLLQEAVDSIRNSRDTLAFQRRSLGGGWSIFTGKYNSCFGPYGCDIKMESFDPTNSSGVDILACVSSGCDPLNYNPAGGVTMFYNHVTTAGEAASIFTRTIKMTNVSGSDVHVDATVTWKNGAGTSTKTLTLSTELLDWQQ